MHYFVFIQHRLFLFRVSKECIMYIRSRFPSQMSYKNLEWFDYSRFSISEQQQKGTVQTLEIINGELAVNLSRSVCKLLLENDSSLN